MRAPRLRSVVSAHAAIVAESITKETESPVAGSQIALPRSATGPAPASPQARWSLMVSIANAQDVVVASHSSCVDPSPSVTGPVFVLAIVSKYATRRPPTKVRLLSGRTVPVESRTFATCGYTRKRRSVRALNVPAKPFATTPFPRSSGDPYPPKTSRFEAKSFHGIRTSTVTGSPGSVPVPMAVGTCS